MGKRGIHPQPVELKAARGRYIPPAERNMINAPPASELPEPPERLLPLAKEEYYRLGDKLLQIGMLSDVDLIAFTEMCQNYALYIAADEKLMELGVTAMQETPNGYKQAHPVVTMRRNYYEIWRKDLMLFGLTPSSRKGLLEGENGIKIKSVDPMDALLRGEY